MLENLVENVSKLKVSTSFLNASGRFLRSSTQSQTMSTFNEQSIDIAALPGIGNCQMTARYQFHMKMCVSEF